MAISFVSSARGTATSFPGVSSNTSTITINKPASVVAGDLMVAFIEMGTADMTTVPSGWTLLNRLNVASSNMTSEIYYRFVTGSEGASFTWVDDSANTTPACGAILAYRGVDPNVPFDDQQNGGDDGTTPADPDTGPTLTTTSTTWVLYFRAGKTATVASEGTFSGTGTMRQRFSNRGGSTQYFCEVWDSNANVAAGSPAGKSLDASHTLTGSIVRTLAITMEAEGSFAASLAPVTAVFAATREIPAGSIGSTLAPVTFDGVGLGQPPSGTVDASLAPVTSSMAGTATGGPMAAAISPVAAALAGSVNPIGSISSSIAPVTVQLVAETRPIGEHIIKVEADHRAFRVPKDDGPLIPIKRSQVTDA